MKPAELLRKQADIMDMAEKHDIENWRALVRYYSNLSGEWSFLTEGYALCEREEYKFALGVVEGKPVFEGDTLYHPAIGAVVANKNWGSFIFEIYEQSGGIYYLEHLSWNPPKPKLPEGFTPWEGGDWTGHNRDIVQVANCYNPSIPSCEVPASSVVWSGGVVIGYKLIKKYEKPKTVMVELLMEDIEFWIELGDMQPSYTGEDIYLTKSANFCAACRKALENLK